MVSCLNFLLEFAFSRNDDEDDDFNLREYYKTLAQQSNVTKPKTTNRKRASDFFGTYKFIGHSWLDMPPTSITTPDKCNKGNT